MAMISAGSVGTFCSKITLPASSTTHTDVVFTDTSRPTKWTILSLLLPRGSRPPDLNPLSSEKEDAHSSSMRAAAAAIHLLSVGTRDLRRDERQRVRRADSGPSRRRAGTGRCDPLETFP